MKSGIERVRKDERGGISMAQVVVVLLVGALLLAAYLYVPGMMRKSAMKDIARNASARMVLEMNDSVIREEIVKKATAAGVVIGQSEVQLKRQVQPNIKYTVTLTWVEKVKYPWGGQKVSKASVSQFAEPGKSGIKNAE